MRTLIAMADDRKRRALEITDSIRQILLKEWDPIGVYGMAPDDEYDAYIGEVYRVLTGSRSEQELAGLLFGIERDRIGVGCESPEQLLPVARSLLAIDVDLD
jgi:hypothetical protein